MSVKAQRPRAKRPPVQGQPEVARSASVAASVATPIAHSRIWAASIGAALIAALLAYWPSMRGEFVFDDAHMPFASGHPEQLSLRAWVIGARPLVNLSYWINFQLDGVNPFGYHVVNVFLHVVAAAMVFLVLRKILQLAEIEDRRG